MTNKELAAIVAAQAEQVEKLTAALAAKGDTPKASKPERKLSISTSRDWTGSNTMLATYRDYGNGKAKRGARLYRAEVDAILGEFGIKPDKSAQERIDAYFLPMG